MAGYKFTFRGVTYSADGLSSQDRDDHLVKTLKSAGYTPPQPWQFWRWGETQLPQRIVERLRS